MRIGGRGILFLFKGGVKRRTGGGVVVKRSNKKKL